MLDPTTFESQLLRNIRLVDDGYSKYSVELSRVYTTIVPTRPSNPYISETLQSIKNQTLPPSRVLVIINGVSTEPENAAIDAENSFPAAEIHHISDAGLVPALRYALRLCVSGYVAFLDADDLWTPEKAEAQIDILESDRSIDVVYGGVQNFYGPSMKPHYESSLVISRLFSASTFRMSAFRKNGPPAKEDNHFNYLYRWWGRAHQSGVQTQAHNETVLFRRVHKNNGWVTQPASGMSILFSELRSMSSKPNRPENE